MISWITQIDLHILYFLLSFVKIKMDIKRSRYKISAKLYAQMIGYEISIDFL